MLKQFEIDEKDWEQEYAVIPQTNSFLMRSTSNTSQTTNLVKPTNATDFSMAYIGNDYSTITAANTDISIGQYFSNRCQDLCEIISAKSPTKHKPIALVSNAIQSG